MGTKLTKKTKKAHNSDTLAGDELQALQSANADQHRDRITRFGILKHRAKLQEQYLWTQVDFKSESEDDLSNKALKAATKLKGCGQFLIFRNYYTIDQVKLEKIPRMRTAFAMSNVCWYSCCSFNESVYSTYRRNNASESQAKARIDHFDR